MLFDVPMIIHSRRDDGRHWFTSLDLPPLQLLPLAANHARVGQVLATLVAHALTKQDDEMPDSLRLDGADFAAIASLAGRYPEVPHRAGGVEVRVVVQAAASEPDEAASADVDEPEFLTPVPAEDWTGSYDEWIVAIARDVGIDAPDAAPASAYDAAMAAAAQLLQERMPSLRERFVAGMDGLNLGFKVGLKTRAGGSEYVWVRPTDWSDAAKIVCVLESRPYNCKGYVRGQVLTLRPDEIADYAIGSESAGVVDPGLTQRIVEDYGLQLP
jgi:hypothetical protein